MIGIHPAAKLFVAARRTRGPTKLPQRNEMACSLGVRSSCISFPFWDLKENTHTHKKKQGNQATTACLYWVITSVRLIWAMGPIRTRNTWRTDCFYNVGNNVLIISCSCYVRSRRRGGSDTADFSTLTRHRVMHPVHKVHANKSNCQNLRLCFPQ